MPIKVIGVRSPFALRRSAMRLKVENFRLKEQRDGLLAACEAIHAAWPEVCDMLASQGWVFE